MNAERRRKVINAIYNNSLTFFPEDPHDPEQVATSIVGNYYSQDSNDEFVDRCAINKEPMDSWLYPDELDVNFEPTAPKRAFELNKLIDWFQERNTDIPLESIIQKLNYSFFFVGNCGPSLNHIVTYMLEEGDKCNIDLMNITRMKSLIGIKVNKVTNAKGETKYFPLYITPNKIDYPSKSSTIEKVHIADLWINDLRKNTVEYLVYLPNMKFGFHRSYDPASESFSTLNKYKNPNAYKFFNTFRGFRYYQPLSYYKNWNETDKDVRANYNETLRTLLTHLMEVICQHDTTKTSNPVTDFILGYLTAVRCDMEKRTEVMWCMMGEQGCGKSIFLHSFQNIFSNYSVYFSRTDQLANRFGLNALEGKLLLAMDEFNADANKKEKGQVRETVKNLLTAYDFHFEKKGVDAVRKKNYVNLIATSNPGDVIPLDPNSTNRRFFISDVSNKYQSNEPYFDEYALIMLNQTGKEVFDAFLVFIYVFDLFPFNRNKIPVTEAYTKQILKTLDPMASFWRETLTQKFSNVFSRVTRPRVEAIVLSLKEIHDTYRIHLTSLNKKYNAESIVEFCNRINKYVSTTDTYVFNEQFEEPRELPTVEKLREIFCTLNRMNQETTFPTTISQQKRKARVELKKSQNSPKKKKSTNSTNNIIISNCNDDYDENYRPPNLFLASKK